ncbi:hypothetical protein CI238_05933, partial [Colletotrichum incanum]
LTTPVDLIDHMRAIESRQWPSCQMLEPAILVAAYQASDLSCRSCSLFPAGLRSLSIDPGMVRACRIHRQAVLRTLGKEREFIIPLKSVAKEAESALWILSFLLGLDLASEYKPLGPIPVVPAAEKTMRSCSAYGRWNENWVSLTLLHVAGRNHTRQGGFGSRAHLPTPNHSVGDELDGGLGVGRKSCLQSRSASRRTTTPPSPIRRFCAVATQRVFKAEGMFGVWALI